MQRYVLSAEPRAASARILRFVAAEKAAEKGSPALRRASLPVVADARRLERRAARGYASMFAYVALRSMNSRRGATSSPMSMENV